MHNIYSCGVLKVKGKSQDTSETTLESRANLKGVDDPGFAEIISSLTMEEIIWEQYDWHESKSEIYAYFTDF